MYRIMNFDNMTKQEIKEMYLNELKHLYDAKKQLEKGLQECEKEENKIKRILNNL